MEHPDSDFLRPAELLPIEGDRADSAQRRAPAAPARVVAVCCPHCHRSTDTEVDRPTTHVTCSSCGNGFSLVDRSAGSEMAAPIQSMGHFELLERIGLGAFSTVWKAHDLKLGRTVALKIPRATYRDPVEESRFLREAQTVAQLNHPHIVAIHEVGQAGETLYLVSDLVNGITLAERMARGRIAVREAADLCATIASALHFAHERGVTHRDLIHDTEAIDLNSDSTTLVIGGQATIADSSGGFDWDGLGGSANHATTEVREGASLTLDVQQFDSNSDPFQYDGTLTIDSGSVSVRVDNNDNRAWIMDRTLNLNNTNGTAAVVSGNPIKVGNDSGTLDADVNVSGGVSQFVTDVQFNSDADVDIMAGADLNIQGDARFAGGEYSGSGLFRPGATNTVMADTVIGLPGTNTLAIDLDQGSWTIESGQSLSLHVATIDPINDGFDNDLTVEDGAVLEVQLPGDIPWRFSSGTLTYQGDPSKETFLAGDPVEFANLATVDVNGRGRITARVDIKGLVQISDATGRLELTGGSVSDPNTLQGGSIVGPGGLQLQTGDALHGFGTIDADIHGTGTSELRANHGTLEINGSVVSVHVLGTADDDGLLKFATALDTSVASDAVELAGGEVSAPRINNDAGTIRGHGQITTTATTLDNYGLLAAEGGVLVIETAGAADLDGFAPHDGEGAVRAVDGDVTVVSGVDKTFNGQLDIGVGRTLTITQSGMGLRNAPAAEDDDGSGDAGQIDLTGGTYRASFLEQASTLRALAAEVSTIDADHIRFEDGSVTVIPVAAGELQVSGETRIQKLATFAGDGTLVNTTGSVMTAEHDAIINVRARNEGELRIGISPGLAQTLDFEQTVSGELEIELAGTAPGAEYDVLDLSPTSGTALAFGVLVTMLAVRGGRERRRRYSVATL